MKDELTRLATGWNKWGTLGGLTHITSSLESGERTLRAV
jgi:hypothetical protein